MKNKLFIISIISVLTFSCSSDKIEEALTNDPSADLIGVWDAVRLEVDNTASSEVVLGGIVLAALANEECYILTFTFNQDLTYVIDNAVEFLDTSDPFDIPCPDQKETATSTFTYDGEILTTLDIDGNTLMIDVTIDGDMITLDGADLGIPNLNSGELIFKKR